MSSTVLALVVTTAICLAFSSTRGFGVLGVFLLFNLYPVLSTLLLAIGGVAFAIYHSRRKRNAR
ncbi:MAG: hypothetical protein AB1593_03950 [Pseudomonadota bacterium]